MSTIFYAYMGKRLNAEKSRLLHAFIQVDQKGIPTTENGYGEYTLSETLPFALETQIGNIYQLQIENTNQIASHPQQASYFAQHLYTERWKLEDQAAQPAINPE